MSHRITIGTGLLACGGGTDQQTGSEVVRPSPLGACLDSTPQPAQRRTSVFIEGRVREVGLGLADPSAAASCPLGGELRFGEPYLGDAGLLAQTSWMRIQGAAGDDVVLSVLVEGFALPLDPGDGIVARIDREPPGLGPDVASVELRTGDGALLLWIGAAARVADLAPPNEIVLSSGPVDSEVEDPCVGSYALRAVNVEVDGAEPFSVSSGGRDAVGPWSVVNAVTQEQTGATACADAFADQARIAVWARGADVLESGGIGGPCYGNLPIEHAVGAPQYLCMPDGTLSRDCSEAAPCPGVSLCDSGLCRLPGSG